MKIIVKIIAAALILPFFFSCSSDEDEKAIEDIDPTDYIVAGQLIDEHIVILAFETNNEVSIKSLDDDFTASYTVQGDKINIEGYGNFVIQNHAIVSSQIQGLDFNKAKLLRVSSQNVFIDKNFSGNIDNGTAQSEFFVRFSSSGTMYGYGLSFNGAEPMRNYMTIENVIGYTNSPNYKDLFYIDGNKLFYEIKADLGAGTPYYYGDGLQLIQ